MADDQKPKRTGAEGYGAGWAAVSYLIAGIGIWTFIGWLVASLLDIPVGIGITVGMVLGAAGAIYLIVKRLDT
jgi:ATP synthase protein I